MKRKKLILLKDHFTSDGALYKDEIVYLHSDDETNKKYRVESKMGKFYTIEQNKVKVLE